MPLIYVKVSLFNGPNSLRGGPGTNKKKRMRLLKLHEKLPGLQSVRSEQTERRTFEMVRAGLQLSFKISRQITPCKIKKQEHILLVLIPNIKNSICKLYLL